MLCNRFTAAPPLAHIKIFALLTLPVAESMRGDGPELLDKPADGNLLVCCSQPVGDVVIDL